MLRGTISKCRQFDTKAQQSRGLCGCGSNQWHGAVYRIERPLSYGLQAQYSRVYIDMVCVRLNSNSKVTQFSMFFIVVSVLLLYTFFLPRLQLLYSKKLGQIQRHNFTSIQEREKDELLPQELKEVPIDDHFVNQ